MHHLAIATTNIQEMKDFYKQLPGIHWMKDHFREDGSLRSAWFQCGATKTILMIEEEEYSRSAHALVFAIHDTELSRDQLEELLFTKLLLRKCGSTKHTIYFEDPDGNRLGYSDYPI